jgi:tetratricopeptide (TPR) repeat protein
MNKKITVVSILFLVVSVFLFPARKEQQDLYLKAVAEKDLPTKMELLKEYAEKYGDSKDKFLRFIYLNLSETAYKLQEYDEAIQYGETSLAYEEELDPTNKLNVLFYLANSYYVTRKDFDKGLEYATTIIELSNSVLKKMQESEQEQEKIDSFVKKYQVYYIAPAYRLQALIWYAKGKDNTEYIKKAAENAIKAFDNDDGSENSYKLVFSLAGNLYGKNLYNEAIAVTEKIIDKENPKYKEVFFLANLYLKTKNKDKALDYFELAYKVKRQADLALRIGQMVHKQDIDKGIRYFADAYVLSQFDKESKAYKYLEHLYFNEKAKDQSPEEKEKGFKAIIDAARTRFGMGVEKPGTGTETNKSSDRLTT